VVDVLNTFYPFSFCCCQCWNPQKHYSRS